MFHLYVFVVVACARYEFYCFVNFECPLLLIGLTNWGYYWKLLRRFRGFVHSEYGKKDPSAVEMYARRLGYFILFSVASHAPASMDRKIDVTGVFCAFIKEQHTRY